MDIAVSPAILFIGSNPSQRSSSTLPFWEDSKSRKILDLWLSRIALDHQHSIIFANVSDDATENNRPLRAFEIHKNIPKLKALIENKEPLKIVALGKTASKALTLLRVNFYEMPHPSGLNRKLNDKRYVEEKIKELNDYLSSPVIND